MSEAVKQRARAGIVSLCLVASIIIGASLSSATALAAGATSETSFKDAGTLELPRMVVPALGRSGASGAQVTFIPVLEPEPDAFEDARASAPAYRDVILTTTLGYLAFTLDHMRPVDPDRLRRLIVERLAATKLAPIRSLLLQSFVIKPSAVTN